MPSSKLPVHDVMVSDQLIEYAKQQPNVLLNLRVEQRPEILALRELSNVEKPFAALRLRLRGDGIYVHDSVIAFLEHLKLPAVLLIHFQGYGLQTGTAVINLERRIYWTHDDHYPRLDFAHPAEMQRIHGCPNFWGAFIIAIAQVPQFEDYCEEDPDGSKFIALCDRLLLPMPQVST